MPRKIIRITDARSSVAVPPIPAQPAVAAGALLDRLGRPLSDLRISVTDRCNFRCIYCMPAEIFDKNYRFLPQSSLLSFEEITRIARIFVANGVTKIRLTGGEPLLRKNIEQLIEMLAGLRTPDGQEVDLALTTNGSVLAKKAQALKNAGLKRVTVSLDAIHDATFKRMNDVDFPVSDVLRGIDAAHQAGLAPVKINMVVKAGVNDHEIVPMARRFKGSSSILRFIEYMDVGTSNGWTMNEVIPSSEVADRINAVFPIEAVQREHSGATASRWRYKDGSGEIGMISSVTQAFCHDCTRARLSTEGVLYTCLFASRGHDIRALLRQGRSDDEVIMALTTLWSSRNDRYSELRSELSGRTTSPIKKVEMSYIGG